MTECEKAELAILVAVEFLKLNRKIKAVAMVKQIYETNLKTAKHFVDRIENLMKEP